MTGETSTSKWKNLALRQEIGLLLIVIVEALYFNAVGHNFGTLQNGYDLVRHSVEIGLLALAMTPIILTGGIDLSVGSLLGLSAILFGKLWRDAHLPVWGAATAAVGLAGLGGALNAALITALRLPPLIVTLATFSLFRGLAEGITHGVDTFTGFPELFLRLGQGESFGMPTQAPLFLLVAIAIWFLVHRTTFGRSWRAIGFSPEGALYASIPVRRRIAMAYVLAGIITGLAAIVYTSRLGQAKADAGTGYELFAITAVVLGGTSIFGGIGSVYGTLLGVAALAMLSNGLILARQPREVGGILTGALLLLALATSVLQKRFAARRVRSYRPARSI
jgi:rhamnose transport system permease protein